MSPSSGASPRSNRAYSSRVSSGRPSPSGMRTIAPWRPGRTTAVVPPPRRTSESRRSARPWSGRLPRARDGSGTACCGWQGKAARGTDQTHRAFSVAVEAGHEWSAAPWRPWLRAGFLRASGDDDPADDRHGTFFRCCRPCGATRRRQATAR